MEALGAGPAWLLASALLHAAWNALLKRERSPQAASLGVLAAAVVFSAVAVALWPGAALPRGAALGWAAAAGAFEAVYFVTLGEALARASYGVVYAIARGGALVVVWPAAALLLGEPVTPRSAGGAALVGLGVALVARAGRARASRGGLALSVACAASIAGYHLCYDRALLAGATPAPLFAVAFAVALPAVFGWARRRGGAAGWGGGWRTPLRWAFAGAVATASFLLFLGGLARSGAGPALTIRNTSVVFAQLLALAMGEAVPRRQALGAALVVAGAALVAAG